jgi:hypothetical protein
MRDQSRPMPNYVSELFEAERAAPAPTRETATRVRSRVAATLVGAATGGAAATTATAAVASGLGAGVLTSVAAKVAVLAVVFVATGATAGVVLHRQRHLTEAGGPFTASATRVVAEGASHPNIRGEGTEPLPSPSDAPIVETANMPTSAAQGASSTRAMSASPTPAPRRSPRPRYVASNSPSHIETVREPAAQAIDDSPPSTLAEEQELINAARTALGAHDPTSARLFLERHARLYPTGQMEEEREALAVQALIAEGDGQAARVRAEKFRTRFPRSIQLQVVSKALRTIP